MAVVLSGTEVVERLRAQRGVLDALIRQRRDFERQAESMEDAGYDAATIATTINGLLTDWGALRDEMVTNLSAIPIVYQSKVKIGMPANYTSAVIKASDPANSNYGTIQVEAAKETYTSPFSVFQASDVVSITSAEDDANNLPWIVRYTPATAGTDKCTNGGFASSASWTEAATGITFSGGKCNFLVADYNGSITFDELYQAKAAMTGGAWTDGARYLVTFTISSYSAGSLSTGTVADRYQATFSSDGTHSAIVTADSDTKGLIFTPSTFTGSIDNVSIIPWNGLAFTGGIGSDNTADTSLVITLQER